MKVKFAVAFAVLLFASVARADGIETDNGLVYIPDGSVVTSLLDTEPDLTVVSFTFADGTGVADANGVFGAGGTINFTVPVSDLSFGWVGNGNGPGYVFDVTDNVGDIFHPSPTPSDPYPPLTGTETFAGPGITSLGWGTYSVPGGISSLNYTLDTTAPVPESSSLLLSGMGLAVLIGLARRHRTKGQKATV